MKSINFTVLREKLIKGEKKQTTRCLFIPPYIPEEIVWITYKKIRIYQAVIGEYYPKKIQDLTTEEAIRDGFNTKEGYIEGLMKINNIKDPRRFCFVIPFEHIGELDYDFLDKLTRPKKELNILNWLIQEVEN